MAVTSRDSVIPHGGIRRCALLSPSESMMPCKVSASSGDLEEDVGYKMRIVSINQLGKLVKLTLKSHNKYILYKYRIISIIQLGKFFSKLEFTLSLVIML